MSNDFAADLALALELADAADTFTLPRFRERSFSVDVKDNLTEVTEVDRGAEALIMDVIRRERPHHGWYGEEHGSGEGDGWTWVVDPIDGTSNFVRGVPVWATLIALVHDDMGPVLGVVSAPALNCRWWGVTDGAAFKNGSPIRVSHEADIMSAHASLTPNSSWNTAGKSQNLYRLQNMVKRVRGFGDFWQHMLVADGSIDFAVDAIGLEPYDIAALVPIVQAAGGRLSDRHGASNWRANSAVSSNGLLHDSVIAVLNS
jgi:histidinol-phosphatase